MARWYRRRSILFAASLVAMVTWVMAMTSPAQRVEPELAGSLREETAETPSGSKSRSDTTTTTTTSTPPVTEAPPEEQAAEEPPTTEAPITTTTEAPAASGFDAGLKMVGSDVAPGRYVSSGELCFWERLSGTGGTQEELIATDSTTGQSVVEIGDGDVAFNSSGCARWEPLASGPAGTTIGEGTFAVGSQVEPGTYNSAGASFCYWERLSGLGGLFDEVITSASAEGVTSVTLEAGDAGFSSFGCGGWTKV